MASDTTLVEAREAFARKAWSAARSAYQAAGDSTPMTLDDLERHAIAAHLMGDEGECRDVLARGHRLALELGDVIRAVRFAFFISHSMIFTGEMGQGSGWLSRARGLLAEHGVDCVEWGYLLIPSGVDQMFSGALEAACSTFTDAYAIGKRFADANLLAMAGHGRGRVLIRLGSIAEAMAVLDETMVSVAAREISPMLVGHLYCGVLEACQEVFDVRRAREWTAVLTRWCEGQPDLVPYRGPCLVHRVELMRLRGDWEDALTEARRACEWLSAPLSPEGPADAFYQLGELYRLRGDFPAAEDAYRQASRLGRPTEPGLALLWLTRGRVDAAEAAVRRALEEAASESAHKAELLSAYVDILLARQDIHGAAGASQKLADLAHEIDAAPLRAMADRAEGSVLIARGQPQAALTPLRRAWKAWKELDAPYEAAMVRLLIGRACRAVGDEESAAMEVDAARWIFEQLGAVADLANIDDAGAGGKASRDSAGLTGREIEVLGLIAAGETNRAIAATLVISEHTVARHVQNMLQKLGFSSRVALAAFAVEKGLAGASHSQN